MRIGARIRDAIDEAIREAERVVLVLSLHTMSSTWVEKEFETTFEEERLRDSLVLVPIRIDDSPLLSKKAWIADIKRSRNIGDFSAWQKDSQYKLALTRLLKDLRKTLGSDA